ncbi:uncharacterized protein LOC123322316 [Coccinella septempunctata]|uniref:uncharacterized protein LOC123319245 n=1 Tax=Coccinella septempunctata TaxID=41139 RepID=UPI001D08171F|nr:uncharacterized protein LOC123319245 [Coccinella septempunctata]XP_044766193.1 uncharacterized protein LOC123322316 [Coccinella septempunctata]
MSDKLGALREYDIHSDWTIYNRRLESYFKANGIEDDEKKRAILLNSLNEEAYKLMYNLCMPVVPENKQYNELTSIFDEHFKSSLSPFAARYKFYNSAMDAHETVANWAARVRSLAGQCEFGSTVYDWVLRDRFIIGFEKGPIQDRLFEEKITCSFSDVITIASSKMAAQKNSCMEEVKIEPGLHHISQHPRTPSTAQNRSVMSDSGASGSGVQNRRKKCTVCGRRNHFTSDYISPKFIKARPLPYGIKEKVEKEIDRLIELGVLKQVDYSRWASPIVPVLKKDGSVRICGDFKITINPHLEVDQFPLPLVDDILAELGGSVIFSKIDLSHAYNQVELEEESQDSGVC